jgi:hypothetical protein
LNLLKSINNAWKSFIQRGSVTPFPVYVSSINQLILRIFVIMSPPYHYIENLILSLNLTTYVGSLHYALGYYILNANYLHRPIGTIRHCKRSTWVRSPNSCIYLIEIKYFVPNGSGYASFGTWMYVFRHSMYVTNCEMFLRPQQLNHNLSFHSKCLICFIWLYTITETL